MISRVTLALIKFVQPLATQISSNRTGTSTASPHKPGDYQPQGSGSDEQTKVLNQQNPPPQQNPQSQTEIDMTSGFDRFQPTKSEKKKSTKLKIIKASQEPDQDLAESQEENAAAPIKTQSSTKMILDIFASLKEKGEHAYQGIGIKTYKNATGKQKKAVKLKKGSIIDQSAD